MNRFANHAALFIESTKHLARPDGISRAFARNMGLELRLVRASEGLATLDKAAAESVRMVPPTGSDKTSEQHAVEQACMHPVNQSRTRTFHPTPSQDVSANDEWHSSQAVREAVSVFGARKSA